MTRRIGYDPMMCPQRYHAWRQKLREHGFEGAGDYWRDWSGREYSLISAVEVVALRESYARMGERVRVLGAEFARMAEALKPTIASFFEAIDTPEMRRLATITGQLDAAYNDGEMEEEERDFLEASRAHTARVWAEYEEQRIPLTHPDQIPKGMGEEEAREFFDAHEVTEEYVESAGEVAPEDLPAFRPKEDAS